MTNIRHERVAIVPGVGPGLGAALVRKLAHEGCRVGMFARSPQFIGKLAAELGPRVLAVSTDISDPTQASAGFRRAPAKLGAVEILIQPASDSIGAGLPHATRGACERRWR